MSDKQRIVSMQKQVRLARTALEKIKADACLSPSGVAEDALDEMFKLDQKQPLQGLVGHERRPRP